MLGLGEISALLFGTGFFGGNLAGAVIGEVLGSRVDARVCKGFGTLRDRVFKPTPENHDLQKAFLRALRDGIEATTRQQLKALTQAKALSKSERKQVEDWLSQIFKDLNQLIKDVAQGGWAWRVSEDYGLLLNASAAELSGLTTQQVKSELQSAKSGQPNRGTQAQGHCLLPVKMHGC